jgi:hypothetical protein
MSSVPIVQGTAVPVGADDVNNNSTSEYAHLNESSGDRPEVQPQEYRDVVWAVAFYVHLIAVIAVITYNLKAAENNAVANDYSGVLYLLGITAASTIALGSATLQFMMKYPVKLVQSSLIITVALSGIIAIIGLVSGDMFAGILGLVFFAIGVCYARSVWPRIPYAAANLNTALTAVKANMGITVIAYGMVFIAFG